MARNWRELRSRIRNVQNGVRSKIGKFINYCYLCFLDYLIIFVPLGTIMTYYLSQN